MAKKPYIIALEEHYQDPEVKQLSGGPGAGREMDEAGIDLQVLSHSTPGLQVVDAEAGPALARRTNDRLHEAVQRHPDRFSAFAVVPTANPRAAADELERAATKLGFKGAMVNGMTGGVFHDDKRFWPIWERAAKLDVPIYIHPALPHPAVIEAYYKDDAHSHIPVSCVPPGASRSSNEMPRDIVEKSASPDRHVPVPRSPYLLAPDGH
jgi:2,3-dihydroxybenzoate decarboxylase